jgi:hypothetical protein
VTKSKSTLLGRHKTGRLFKHCRRTVFTSASGKPNKPQYQVFMYCERYHTAKAIERVNVKDPARRLLSAYCFMHVLTRIILEIEMHVFGFLKLVIKRQI